MVLDTSIADFSIIGLGLGNTTMFIHFNILFKSPYTSRSFNEWCDFSPKYCVYIMDGDTPDDMLRTHNLIAYTKIVNTISSALNNYS